MMKPKEKPTPKTDWKWFESGAKESAISKAGIKKIATPTTLELTPAGHVFQHIWRNVAGANKVEVIQADLQFAAHLYPRTLGSIDTKTASGGKSLELDLNKDEQLLTLKINGLKSGTVSFADEAQLAAQSRRLICSAKLNGEWVPLYAVPKLGKRGAIPAMLGGASFAHSLFSLPGTVTARHWRLELVEGNKVEDLAPHPIQSGSIVGSVLQSPKNPKILGPAGNSLWEQTGLWQGKSFVSVKIPLEQAIQETLPTQEEEITSSYRFTGDSSSKVDLFSHVVRGQLLRERPGVWTHQLQGEPQTLNFEPPLSAETPGTVVADMTLTYSGIRQLHLQATPQPIKTLVNSKKTVGTIVSAAPVLVALPPRMFGEGSKLLPPARIGFFGRAATACEMTVRFVDIATQKVIGSPAVLNLEAKPSFAYHWFSFPNKPFPADLPQLELLATRGRFYWVGSRPQDLLWAVYDPDPGGRPVLLNGIPIAQMSDTKLHAPKRELPRNAFHTTHPILSSDLFLKAEFTDLHLRYPR